MIKNKEFDKAKRKTMIFLAKAEADICLSCPLPNCDKNVCARFKKLKKELKIK